MKYTLVVDQRQMISIGITNINQAHILSLLAESPTWAEPVVVDGKVYYWTARQKIVDELPILSLKHDTVYRHLKALADAGVIDYIKDGKKDCIRLTDLGKSCYVGNESEYHEKSEMNPGKLGNESEKNSEMNPTYNNNQYYQNTNDNKKTSKKELTVISDEEPREVAYYLYEKILTVQPNAKLNPESWIKDIEKAIRIDGRPKYNLIKCIDWIYHGGGDFWIPNIMSGKKLREKYDQMEIQSKRSKQKKISETDRTIARLAAEGRL